MISRRREGRNGSEASSGRGYGRICPESIRDRSELPGWDGWLVDWWVQHCRRMAKIWADRAYRGRFEAEAEAQGIDVEIVVPEPGQKGFQVQPRRWVVERTFAWLSNYRRLSKDFEHWLQTSDAAIYAAMSYLMVRRLARLRATN